MNNRRRRLIKSARYWDRVGQLQDRTAPSARWKDQTYKITASMWGAGYNKTGKEWRRSEEFNRRYPTVFFGGGLGL